MRRKEHREVIGERADHGDVAGVFIGVGKGKVGRRSPLSSCLQLKRAACMRAGAILFVVGIHDGNVSHYRTRVLGENESMEFGGEQGPREFLQQAVFSPEKAHDSFPNARRQLVGGIFISHSGLDRRDISEKIIRTVVRPIVRGEGYFLHSRLSGGAEGYRRLVQAALHWCDKFMVVISEHSIGNEWVLAEVEWALERNRPIVAASLDGHAWRDIVDRLGLGTVSEVPSFDLSRDTSNAQQELMDCLKSVLDSFPQHPEQPLAGQ